MTFKVGDRVRVVREMLSHGEATQVDGRTGTLVSVSSDYLNESAIYPFRVDLDDLSGIRSCDLNTDGSLSVQVVALLSEECTTESTPPQLPEYVIMSHEAYEALNYLVRQMGVDRLVGLVRQIGGCTEETVPANVTFVGERGLFR